LLQCFVADGHVLPAVKSTDVIAPTAAEPTVDTLQSEIRKSRKSLSLDNLQTVGNDGLMGDADAEPGHLSQSMMYARNRSFRVAVDKSFDVPSVPAYLIG